MNTLAVFDLSSTARTAGLGMDYLALFDNDLTIGIGNPSMLRAIMNGTGVLSFVPMFDGSNMGTLAYAHTFEHIGTMSFGFRFFNYGRFHGYDEEENYEGDFGAGDYSLVIGWGMWVDSNFSIGVYRNPMIFKNRIAPVCTTIFIRTFDRTVEALPFELSAALSYKLRGAPFRVFFAATELQRWNLRYDDPLHPTTTIDPFTGEVSKESWLEGTLDNLLRHTLIGVELNLGRSLFARVGYSYRQGREMIGADIFNLSAFSFGIGLRTKRFEFGYARRNYHLSQAPNYLTLTYKF